MLMMDRIERQKREKIVVDEYGGMLPYAEVFYIASVIYAAEAAILAFSRYEAHCERDENGGAASAIHESLTHAAALSRFFWPSKTTPLAHARAAHLRNAFAVDEASPLKSRGLRNALEHFDERLDEFLLGDCVGHIFPDPMIGPATLAEDPVAKIFKLVDPNSATFVVLNEPFLFEPIMEEVGRILELAYEFYDGRSLAAKEEDPPVN